MSIFNEYVERLSNVYIGESNIIQLCLDNNIPVKDIVEKFIKHRSIERLKKYSDSELAKPLIDNALAHKHRIKDKSVYDIGGLTASEYSAKYHLITQSLRAYLRKELEKNPNADTVVIAEQFRRICENREEDYSDFIEYCKKHNIPTRSVYQIYNEEYKGKSDVPKKEALYLICDFLIDEQRKKLKGRKK